MKYGIREVCDVMVKDIKTGEPRMHFDSLKTSSLEQATTTVYAQGGKGAPRLIAWDGEKVVTFVFEDALISPIGLQLLTGGKINTSIKDSYSIVTWNVNDGFGIYEDLDKIGFIPDTYHIVSYPSAHWNEVEPITYERTTGKIYQSFEVFMWESQRDFSAVELTYKAANLTGSFDTTASWRDGYSILRIDERSDSELERQAYRLLNMYPIKYFKFTYLRDRQEHIIPIVKIEKLKYPNRIELYTTDEQAQHFYWYIETINFNNCSNINIDPKKFAGTYYFEGTTKWRDINGKDHEAEFIIPKGKIKTNMSIIAANTGDPSTFTYEVDALPGYIKGSGLKKKVNAAIQLID